MAFLNEFQVFGSLLADPVVVSTGDGTTMLKIYVDCVHKELDSSGTIQEHNSVIPVSIYGKHDADILNLAAGAVVGVQGHIKGTFDLATGKHTTEFIAANGRVVIVSPAMSNLPKPNPLSSTHQQKNKSKFAPAVA